MRAIVQRVQWARVTIDGQVTGACGPGLLVLVGAHRRDTEEDARKLADRVFGLRIFGDSEGKMNLSLSDAFQDNETHLLAISNFTVYGDATKSRRPSFTESAGFERGKELFDLFVRELESRGPVALGEFGADMQIELQNDGPVTLMVDAGPSGQ